MTTGSGLIHSELVTEKFKKSGGIMQGLQIWVNLPRKNKRVKPWYQHIKKDTIPTVEENKNIEIEFVNLEENYKKDFTSQEIDDFIRSNKDKLKKDFINFSYVKITPQSLLDIEEYNDEFAKTIECVTGRPWPSTIIDSGIPSVSKSIVKLQGTS